MAREATIETRGLREFRRDLRRLNREVDKELRQEIRAAAFRAREEAAALAPRDTGTLAASLRVSITTRGAAIYSRLPYAAVVHWGGTIEPRGVPIDFPRTEFITRAIDHQADQIVEDIGDSVNRAARRVGWK